MTPPSARSSESERASSDVRSWGSTPSQPRVTSPLRMICSSTERASVTGIAKPMPIEPPDCEKIALLMPIRLPFASTSAPPELPGLIGASVWMKSSKRLMPSDVRPSAETMPDVTVWPKPKAFPIASTGSPTSTCSSEPNVIDGSPVASAFSTARSLSGSEPVMRALSTRPSANTSWMSSAPETTWWLVSTYPSGETMTPEPSEFWRCGGSFSARSGKKRRSIRSSSSGLAERTSLLV